MSNNDLNEQKLGPRKKEKPRLNPNIVLICFIAIAAVVLNQIMEYRNRAETNKVIVEKSITTAATTTPVLEPVKEEPAANAVGEPVELYDDDLMVAEDHFQYITINLKDKTDLSYEYKMNSGPNLDFYLVDDDGLFMWERMVEEGTKETQLMTYADFNSSATSRDYKEGTLAAGTYYLIIDNTDYGAVMPPMNLEDDVATLHVTIVGAE